MKRVFPLILAAALMLSLAACGGGETGDTNTPSGGEDIDNSSTSNPSGADVNATDNDQEITVPNNGEWDEILCSGGGYHLVKKEIDTFEEYKIMVGVVDDDGEWVHELSNTGAVAEGIQMYTDAYGAEENTLLDSNCYMYLGDGVFIGSPSLLVYSADSEYRLGLGDAFLTFDYGDEVVTSGWDSVFWNVIDNVQMGFRLTRISMFQGGYALLTQTADYENTLYSINTKGQITELPCNIYYNSDDPVYFQYKFPVYSDGLFFAHGDGFQTGFFDIEGNLIIDLSSTDMTGIPYCEELGINAPYFENGEATILFKNNGDTVYRATIDKTGEYIGEPQKTDIKVQ